MEGQPSSSLSKTKCLAAELTKKLTWINPELTEKFRGECIYEVPQDIRQVNPIAYTPSVVSIGPFHKPCGSDGENNTLNSMEDVKLKYVAGFLKRSKLSMEDLFDSLEKTEGRIRSCYSRPIDISSYDFLMMIVVDACFIIEHFLRTYTGLDSAEGDPSSESWLLYDIFRDLILLENQLPFFVLEDIFDSVHDGMHLEFPYENVDPCFVGPVRDVKSLSFLHITFFYFRKFNDRLNIAPSEIIEKPKHFTDLLRTFMQPLPFPDRTKRISAKNLPSASQLSEAGMVFKVSYEICLFNIKYDRRKKVMELPYLIVDDDTERLFRNILIFERCHCRLSPHVTQYLFFLSFLIKTDKDVDILIDKGIIVNWTGDANVVAKMFNSLCSPFILPFLSEEHCCIHEDLIEFYNPRNKYRKFMAIFYREYFNNPWKKASTISAFLLLLFTLIQTLCSLISLPSR